tara:strand:+ start:108 stop:728 length:621 start_codon:yes stop_codon:yes gene_type:complete
MRSRPTRIVAVTDQPTSIRKVAEFANDPNAYPVTFATLRYASGGGTVELVSEVTYATGTITIATNLANNETVVVNGVTFTAKSASPTGAQFLIGADAAETAENFALVLNASANGSINVASYSVSDDVITITYDTAGDGGNAYTLNAGTAGAKVTLSAATLEDGGPTYGEGQVIDAAADFVDIDQSLTRWAIASTGSVDLSVTDAEA